MKKALPILFFLIAMQMVCTAQFTDKYWLVGRHVGLDFNSGLPVVNTFEPNTSLLSNSSSSICDRNGNLLFYCSASKVYNKNRQIMPNGSGFNHGTISDNYINTDYYPLFMGATIVPFPKDTNRFYVFYENMEWNIDGNYLPEKLMYLIVDMKLNGGLGDVILKEQPVISGDTLSNGEIMAVKHGNGQDWWVICRKYKTGIYYKVLLDSNGVQNPVSQNMNVTYVDKDTTMINYTSNLSLDGEHFCYLYASPNESTIELMDFDRCTGFFYNHRQFNWKNAIHPNSFIRSCCFSPNNKYLYISDWDSIWQLDLTANNILGSAVFLKVHHNVSQFFIMKNAPDGQIYISHYGSWKDISVIQYPDNIGTACNFLEDTIHFGTQASGPWADGGIPNVPNLKLGALKCDIGIENTSKNNEILFLYPNPVTNLLTFVCNQSQTFGIINSIEIKNILGQKQNVIVEKITTNNCQLNTENLPSGIYFIKTTDVNGNSKVAKFVKQ